MRRIQSCAASNSKTIQRLPRGGARRSSANPPSSAGFEMDRCRQRALVWHASDWINYPAPGTRSLPWLPCAHSPGASCAPIPCAPPMPSPARCRPHSGRGRSERVHLRLFRRASRGRRRSGGTRGWLMCGQGSRGGEGASLSVEKENGKKIQGRKMFRNHAFPEWEEMSGGCEPIQAPISSPYFCPTSFYQKSG